MYCSTCGTELPQALKFCNRCGAQLMPSETLVSVSKPKGLVWVIALGIIMIAGISVSGLALVLRTVMEFFSMGVPVAAALILALLSISMLFGIVWALSRQISRLINSYLEIGESVQKPDKKAQLKAKQQGQIAAVPVQPVMSVTEQTTRTLDPIYRE